MARTSKAKKSVDVAASTVTFDFGAGSAFAANLNGLPSEIIHRLALHGLAQKLGDSYAGDVASPEHEVRSVYANLAQGTWSERGTGEGGGPRITLLAEALALVKAHDFAAKMPHLDTHEKRAEFMQAKVDDMDDAAEKAIRANPTVKAAMEKIKADRARARANAARDAAKGQEVGLDNLL